MIENTHKAITDYAEAYKGALAIKKQALDYIETNYKEGSEVYKNSVKKAEEVMNESLKPMKDMCIKKAIADLDDARKAITKAVTVEPSPEVIGFLPIVKEGKMSERELQMFVEKFKGNYMNDKILSDAMGKYFKTVEGVMDDVDKLEKDVRKYFDTYGGEGTLNISYHNALMMKGSSVEAVQATVNEFLSKYSGKE